MHIWATRKNAGSRSGFKGNRHELRNSQPRQFDCVVGRRRHQSEYNQNRPRTRASPRHRRLSQANFWRIRDCEPEWRTATHPECNCKRSVGQRMPCLPAGAVTLPRGRPNRVNAPRNEAHLGCRVKRRKTKRPQGEPVGATALPSTTRREDHWATPLWI